MAILAIVCWNSFIFANDKTIILLNLNLLKMRNKHFYVIVMLLWSLLLATSCEKMVGMRIRQESQQWGDSDFGIARFKLQEGRYFLVALAHSGKGNPTSTNVHKIGFTNKTGYTDTFLYADSLVVGEEEVDDELQLKRIVSKVKFVFNDQLPEDADSIRFYYEGGSGTFDATTGLGVVKSKQQQWFPVRHDTQRFEIYTIPRADSDKLKVLVTTTGSL